MISWASMLISFGISGFWFLVVAVGALLQDV